MGKKKYKVTNNHFPTFSYEFVETIGKRDYAFLYRKLKNNRNLYWLQFGLFKNNRMIEGKVFKSDEKKVLQKAFDLFIINIVGAFPYVKGFIFKVEHDKAERYYNIIERYSRKTGIMVNIRDKYDEDYIWLAVVRKPFHIIDLMIEFTMDKPLQVDPIKLVVVKNRKVKEVEGNSFMRVKFGDLDTVVQTSIVSLEIKNLEIDIEKVVPEQFSDETLVKARLHDRLPSNVVKYSEDIPENFYESLEYEDESLIEGYTNLDYTRYNAILRDDASSVTYFEDYKRLQKFLEIFDKVPPITKDIVVLRSFGSYEKEKLEHIEELKEGDIYVDPGLISASYKLLWAKRYIMKIIVPKGSRVIFAREFSSHKGEYEVILSPGSVFKVLKVTHPPEHLDKLSGSIVLTMLYIGNVRNTIYRMVDNKLKVVYEKMEKFDEVATPGLECSGYVFLDYTNKERGDLAVYNTRNGMYEVFQHGVFTMLPCIEEDDIYIDEDTTESIDFDINRAYVGDVIMANMKNYYVLGVGEEKLFVIDEENNYTFVPKIYFDVVAIAHDDVRLGYIVKNPRKKVVEKYKDKKFRLVLEGLGDIFSSLKKGNVVVGILSDAEKYVLYPISDREIAVRYISPISKLFGERNDIDGIYSYFDDEVLRKKLRLEKTIYVEVDPIERYGLKGKELETMPEEIGDMK